MKTPLDNQIPTPEISLKLKKLGFDEPCFGFFDEDGKFHHCVQQQYLTNTSLRVLFPDEHLKLSTPPIWGQIFDWFFEKHNLFITITLSDDSDTINVNGYKIYKRRKNKNKMGLTSFSNEEEVEWTNYRAKELATLRSIELVETSLKKEVEKTGCPVCNSNEKRIGNSLHCWDVEYECGCKIWGALSSDGLYEIDVECPNKLK